MSDASPPWNPPEKDGPIAEDRPRGVTILSVFCLLLGLFGLFGTLISCATTATQGLWSAAPGIGAQQEAAQQALLAQARPFTIAGLGISAFAVVPLALMLAVGAILLLSNRRRGAKYLSIAFSFGLVLEPIRFVLGLVSSIYLRHAGEAAMQAATQGGPHLFGNLYWVTIVAGQLIALVWLVVKLVLYVWGRHTLNAEQVHDWLTSLT